LTNRKPKPNKSNNQAFLGSDDDYIINSMDNTLVPPITSEEITPLDQQITLPRRKKGDNAAFSDISDRSNNTSTVKKLFPSPGVIVKDIHELFKSNKSTRERDSAVINYIKLLFQN